MIRFLIIFILFYILIPLGITYVSDIDFGYAFAFTVASYFIIGNLYDYLTD